MSQQTGGHPMELVARYILPPEKLEQLIKDARAWEKLHGYKYGTDEAQLLHDAHHDGAIQLDIKETELI